MCKLFIATGPLTPKQTRLALLEANRQFRSTEKDGFGFLVANSAQQTARGRYLNPDKYIGYMQPALPQWLSGPQVEEGRIPVNADTLICHGRTSTNVKGIEHVHPFAFQGCYLAHNGMVEWAGAKEQQPTPKCDSEQFFQWLLSVGTWETTPQTWLGWGAIGLYDVKASILTIARHGANLYIARRVKDKGWVMATSEAHLLAVCRTAGIALNTAPLEFPNNLIVRFQGGHIVGDQYWAGFGTRQWRALDSVAYGQPAFATTTATERHMQARLSKRERKQRQLNQKIWNSIDSTKESFPAWEPKAK